MAGALKIISDRLRSIVSIQKITKSMKMVSVAKYARAERLLRSVRPFGDGNKTFYEKLAIKPQDEEVLYFAMTSDRGLCGSCHANVSKKIARSFIESPDKNLKLVCIGDKSKSILHYRFGEKIVLVVKEIGKKPPTFIDASIITLGLRGMGWLDRYWIVVHNKFKSMISYDTAEMYLTNFKGILESPSLIPYDEVDDETVEYYVQFSKVSLLYYAMVESSCSEHSARMSAMDTATKNASEMIAQLRLKYNRGRQASITKELIEIISGAAALKDKE